jgi:hypothetical protein
MEWSEWVLKCAAIITALGIVWKFLSGIVRKIDDLREDIQDLKDHSHENYLSGLRLTIMSSDMPLGERIVAAHKYLKAGGNGEVKKYAIEELHINEIYHND